MKNNSRTPRSWRIAIAAMMMLMTAQRSVGAAETWDMGKGPGAWDSANFTSEVRGTHETTLLCSARNGFITSPPLAIDAGDYDYAEVYYYMTGVSNLLHLVFSPGEDNNFDGHVYTVDLPGRETYKPGRILIPLKGNAEWQGQIRRLRLVLPDRNDGAELKLLGIALRKKQDWLENGAFVARKEDGSPWGWDVSTISGDFRMSTWEKGLTFRARQAGEVQIATDIVHIRQGQRYRLSVASEGTIEPNARAVFYGRHGETVAERMLTKAEDGTYATEYEADDRLVSGSLIISATAARAGDTIELKEAVLENLGGKLQWQGEWIWGDATPSNEQSCLFRHEFEIDDPTHFASALLQVTCDDQFGFWVNGELVAAHNLWAEPQVVDVTQQLRKGRNVLYARAFNRGGPAGFLAELRLNPAGGSKPTFIFTSADWLTTFDGTLHEQLGDQIDPAQWNTAYSFGKPPANPWGNLALHESLPEPPVLPVIDRDRIAQEKMTARINTERNFPRIELNGQVVTPMLFGSRWLGDRTKSFENSVQGGFKLYRLSWEFSEAWRPDGSIDLSGLDKEVEENLRYNPDAHLFLAFRITAPSWWMAQHPQELCKYSDGSTDGHYGLLPSMASEKWLADVEKHLATMVAHIEGSWYASRIVAYMPGSHSGPEWVMTYKQYELPDYSDPMKRYFRDYLRRKYHGDEALLRQAWGDDTASFDLAEIPSAERRSPKDRWLLDGTLDADSIDYNRAHNEVAGDAIMRVMRQLRKEAPNKLTMIYYGYTMTLAQLGFYPQVTGHYDLERVLESGLVDIFASPISYVWREPGDISGCGAMQDTFRRQNVVWLQEADSRSSLTEDSFGHKYNFNLQAAAMENRREFIYSVVNRLGLWFYDMSGGWYDHAVYTDDFQKMHAIYDAALNEDVAYESPVAVFVDEKSLDVTSVGIGNFSTNHPRVLLYDFQRGLAKSGVPYDLLALDDIYDVPDDRYQVLVLVNAYRYDKQLIEHIHKTYDRPGMMVVHLYAPGFSDGGVAGASEMTGINLTPAAQRTSLGYQIEGLLVRGNGAAGLPGVVPPNLLQVMDPNAIPIARYADRSVAGAYKKLPGGGISVYLCWADNGGDLWRVLYGLVDIKPLVDKKDRVAFDGHRLGIMAMDEPGPRKVTLPVDGGRVTDAFSGEEIAADARQFEIELSPGQSVLLQIKRHP